MAVYRYGLYDTAIFGAVAGVEHTLFQVAQGADAAHIKSFTNSRGAGVLPNEESFSIDWIGAYLDEIPLLADTANWMMDSYFEFRVSDDTKLLLPLRMIAAKNAWGGSFELAAAAAQSYHGIANDGYNLSIPIVIPGGTGFRATLFQGVATAATQNVRLILNGLLTRP